MFTLANAKIAIIGLGYVGLPLAVAFSEKFSVVGFDIDKRRIKQLSKGLDSTLEVSPEELKSASSLRFSSDIESLNSANIFIVTVPTPIDVHKSPDLTPLMKASDMLGQVIKTNDIVIYESTVYPGATEEVCIPILERVSGLKFNQEFFAGYSRSELILVIKIEVLPVF
jgi:UDP-N-acetyl-D-galactosamine dehydrogenase